MLIGLGCEVNQPIGIARSGGLIPSGELAGISGTAESVSTHADYPYMPLTLEYELG